MLAGALLVLLHSLAHDGGPQLRVRPFVEEARLTDRVQDLVVEGHGSLVSPVSCTTEHQRRSLGKQGSQGVGWRHLTRVVAR